MITNRHLVVIVEDDASMSHAIQRLLGASGLNAVAFASAEALLESGRGAEAACFIFDIQLAGLSGFDLRRRLVESGVQAPVIFITAHDHPSSREQATALGAAAYLMKPFAGRALLDVVTTAVGKA
jgi:FixJ family two-component response regulator